MLCLSRGITHISLTLLVFLTLRVVGSWWGPGEDRGGLRKAGPSWSPLWKDRVTHRGPGPAWAPCSPSLALMSWAGVLVGQAVLGLLGLLAQLLAQLLLGTLLFRHILTFLSPQGPLCPQCLPALGELEREWSLSLVFGGASGRSSSGSCLKCWRGLGRGIWSSVFFQDGCWGRREKKG